MADSKTLNAMEESIDRKADNQKKLRGKAHEKWTWLVQTNVCLPVLGNIQQKVLAESSQVENRSSDVISLKEENWC